MIVPSGNKTVATVSNKSYRLLLVIYNHRVCEILNSKVSCID